MSKLHACEFCKNDSVELRRFVPSGESDPAWEAVCPTCHARAPAARPETLAIKLWNNGIIHEPSVIRYWTEEQKRRRADPVREDGHNRQWNEAEDVFLLSYGWCGGVGFIASHDLGRTEASARRRLSWLKKNKPKLYVLHWRDKNGNLPADVLEKLVGCDAPGEEDNGDGEQFEDCMGESYYPRGFNED